MNDSGHRHLRRRSGPEFLPIRPGCDTAAMDSTTSNSGPAFVHPTADVEDGAQVGAGTKVWHLAHIRSSATVGDDCVIGRNVYVDANAVVGSRVKIQNNVSVYQGVTIEDEVFVGPCAVFTNDLRPRAHNADWKITPTLVRRGASIGANATLICGIVVGEHAMIAAGSVVTKDVAPYQLVAGNPARPKGWVDEAGEITSRDPATRP
jgi:UDP-2-acetamido-3-amino-2,3-dideoxy-glucuronate N-acetyltransferase